MYCPKCGTPNNDDSAFCVACGYALVPPVTAPPKSKSEPKSDTLAFHDSFCLSAREFITSGFTVFVLVFYSIARLVSIVQASESLEPIREASEFLSSLSIFYESNAVNSIINFVQLLVIAPGILLSIGLWLLFFDNREHCFDIVNTRGLRIISVVYQVEQAFFCIGILIAEIIISKAFPTFETTGFWLGTAVLIAGVFGFFVYQWPIWMLRSMSTAALYRSPNLEYVTTSAVLYFINSGILLLNAISAELTLSSLLVCGQPLLIGILLLKYKTLMQNLYAEQSEAYWRERTSSPQTSFSQSPSSESAPNGTTYSQYRIPAWKRVQKEQESAQKKE